MSEFERPLSGYRQALSRHGDDLSAVAARELGDANRWPELVWINSLRPPYLTDDPGLVGPGVLLTGTVILIPAPAAQGDGDPVADGQVYERDCLLVRKALTVDEGGDLAVVSGAPNLRQQLSHRVATPRGQLLRHPDYGCRIWSLLGAVNGPTAAKLGAEYVKSALRSDYRVALVSSSVAEIVGDAVRVTARAEAITGAVVDVST